MQSNVVDLRCLNYDFLDLIIQVLNIKDLHHQVAKIYKVLKVEYVAKTQFLYLRIINDVSYIYMFI